MYCNPPPTSKSYLPHIGHLPHLQLLQGKIVTQTLTLYNQNLYGLQSNVRELFGGTFGQQGRTMSTHATQPPPMPPPPPWWPPPPMSWPPFLALQVSILLIISPVFPNVDPRCPLLQPLGLSKTIKYAFPLNSPTVISVVVTAINNASKLSPIMTGPVRQMEIFHNILHMLHPLQQLPPPHILPWPSPPGDEWDHVKVASVTICTPMDTTSFGFGRVEAMYDMGHQMDLFSYVVGVQIVEACLPRNALLYMPYYTGQGTHHCTCQWMYYCTCQGTHYCTCQGTKTWQMLLLRQPAWLPVFGAPTLLIPFVGSRQWGEWGAATPHNTKATIV